MLPLTNDILAAYRKLKSIFMRLVDGLYAGLLSESTGTRCYPAITNQTQFLPCKKKKDIFQLNLMFSKYRISFDLGGLLEIVFSFSNFIVIDV